MEKIYNVSNTIENGSRMDRVKSRITPMNHRLWTVIAPMLFVAFGLFGVNENAWGDNYSPSFANTSTTTWNDGKISLSFADVNQNSNGYALTNKIASWIATSSEKDFKQCTMTWSNLNNGYTIKVTQVVAGFKTGISSKAYGVYGRVYVDDNSSYTSKMYTGGGTGTASATISKNDATGFGSTIYFTTGHNSARGETYLNNVNISYTRTPNPYTIVYKGNGSTHGSTANTEATYDENVTFQTNGFYKAKYVVTYDINGGTCGTAVDTAYYPFAGWAKTADGAVAYENGQTTTTAPNLATSGNVNLFAKWGSGTTSVKLPTPTAAPSYDGDGSYSFAGWYDGDTKVGVGGGTYTPTKNVTLKAKWTLTKEPGFSGASQSLKVGETYNFVFSNTSTETPSSSTSANFYYVISTTTVPTGNRDGSAHPNDVISISGNTITALNNGVAKIKFYQKADGANNIAAGESEWFTFTVSRNVPEFTWNTRDHYYYNETVAHFFKSSQTATAITVTSTDEHKQIATIVDSALVMYNKAGTARVTMTQAENYYWAEHTEYRDITPEKKSNHVEFTLTTANQASFKVADKTTGTVVWDSNGYKMSDGTVVGDKPDNNVVLKFEGIPDSLYFSINAERNGVGSLQYYPKSGDYNFEVFESATGDAEDWHKLEWGFKNDDWFNTNYLEGNDSKRHIGVVLSATARYIRLRYHGSCWGRFENIRVTELQYFRRQGENTTLNFATNLKNHAPEVQSFVVEHANAGYQTEITAPAHYQVSLSENSGFANSITYSTNATSLTGGDVIDEFTVYVKYLADSEGTHAGNVVVSNNLRDNISVAVSGETQGLLATHLVYIGKASYPADTTNIAVADLFEVRDANNALVAGATITLGTGDPGKAVIVGTPNAVDPICSGLVNIAASYAGDGVTYAAATNTGISMPITFNAVDDEVSFDSGYESMVVGEEIDLSEWVTSCLSGTEISVTSVSTDYIVIEDGKVKAVAKGDGRLRAESAGDCRYNSGRSFHNITVRNPDDPCGSSVLYKSGTIKCGAYGKNSSSPEIIEIPDGPQDKLTFKVWKYSWYATQGATLEILDNKGNTLENGTFSYNVGDLGTSEPEEQNDTIDLANFPGAKKLKIYGSGTIYKYFKDIRVSQKAYLTASTSSVTMSTVKACETATGQFTVDYSDVSHIQLSQTNNDFSYEVWDGETKLIGFENGCKSYGTYTVKFFYVPQAKGPYSNTVTISASGKSQTITLNGTANAPDRTIVWDIPTANTISATQSVDLTAYAETSCLSPAGGVYYTYSSATEGAATIDGDLITFNKAATVTVTAHTVPHDNYNDALAVDKVWTVGKVGTQMRTLPTITSTITYGDNASVVTYDSKSWKAEDVLNHNEVEGYINYVGPAEFTAAGPQNLIFNFTPKIVGTYDVCQFTVPVTVQQKASIATPVAANITYGQRVNESVLTSGDGSTTAGTWTWKDEAANTQVLAAREEPYTGLHVIFTPDNNNYTTLEATVSLKVDEAPTDVFTNASGDNNWDNPDNWSSGVVPADLEPDIVVEGDLKITEDRTVGKLTIENTGSVSVITGGTLTIKGASDPRTEYGDVHVLNDGAISLGNSADLQVRHFTIDAKLGGYVSENVREESASGQVDNPSKLNINGDAYFKLALDPEGAITYGWYDFVVPFEVNIVGGIFLPSNLATPLTNGYDFAVMSFDEAKRAVKGKEWNKYSGTMQPGRVYTITVDYRHGWNEIVFKKKEGASISGSTSFTPSYSSTLGEAVDRGWNGFGNGTLFHTELKDVSASTLVHVYDHANKCYHSHEAKDYTIAVGTSFFMQVEGNTPIEFKTADNDNSGFMAPARNRSSVERFSLSLMNDVDMVYDHLWVGANEDATEEYVIGKDVLKMGTMNESKIARMWTSKGGHDLCAVNATLSNEQAIIPLSLFAPQDAAYVLAVDAAPADVNLYLTYEGNVIWDLTMSPFEIELTKGTTNGYGLLMEAKAPAVTTGIEESETAGQTMRKVIINNTVYIITPEGKMYDIIGKGVKF